VITINSMDEDIKKELNEVFKAHNEKILNTPELERQKALNTLVEKGYITLIKPITKKGDL